MNREAVRMEEVLETRKIGIDGMTCDNCARRVANALRAVGGVKAVAVDRPAALATVTFDTLRTGIPALCDAVLNCGYRPTTTSDR